MATHSKSPTYGGRFQRTVKPSHSTGGLEAGDTPRTTRTIVFANETADTPVSGRTAIARSARFVCSDGTAFDTSCVAELFNGASSLQSGGPTNVASVVGDGGSVAMAVNQNLTFTTPGDLRLVLTGVGAAGRLIDPEAIVEFEWVDANGIN